MNTTKDALQEHNIISMFTVVISKKISFDISNITFGPANNLWEKVNMQLTIKVRRLTDLSHLYWADISAYLYWDQVDLLRRNCHIDSLQEMPRKLATAEIYR